VCSETERHTAENSDKLIMYIHEYSWILLFFLYNFVELSQVNTPHPPKVCQIGTFVEQDFYRSGTFLLSNQHCQSIEEALPVMKLYLNSFMT